MNLASASFDDSRSRLRRRARSHTALAIAYIVLVGAIGTSWAQTRKPSEYEVKAAYLYNFGKFVKWPATAIVQGNSFPVCILGNDPFGPVLDSLVNGESIDGKRLSTKRISTPLEAAKCRVLFVGVTDDLRLTAILFAMRDTPVLTVGDAPNFLEHGGIVQFVMQNDRVRFLVNLGAAEKAGLVLSSELLKVAVSVKRDTGSGGLKMAFFGNQSISRKLTWMNLAVSAAALLMAGMAFVTYDQVSYRERLVRAISGQAEIIGLNSISAITFDDPDAAALTLSALKASPSILAAEIITPDGRTFAHYENSSKNRINSPPPIPPGQREAHWFYPNLLLSAHTIAFQGKVVGTVYMSAGLQVLRDRLIQYIRIAVVVLILCLIASLLVSAAFRKALATPIAELAETARLVSRDRNYSLRATTGNSHDELSVLVESFNEMLSQIQTRDSALETERARLKALIDNAPVGILFAEAPSGRVVLGNRQVEEILRYPTLASPDIAAYSQWLAFHPDGRRLQPNEFPLYRAVNTGEIVRGEERLFSRGDDTFVWLRMSAAPVRSKDGTIVAGVVAFYDIDEEKKAEQKLRQAYERLAISQSTAKVSDWEWDLSQDRVMLSPQAERQHGLPPGTFNGLFESWVNCVIPEDRAKFTNALSSAIASQSTVETDYRVLAEDGNVRWLLSKATIRNDEQGRPVGMLGVSMDISTLKQAQEALLQSEKLAAAGRLAASISHEINNPLESVTNLLFLVATDQTLSDTTRRFVQQAEQELARVGHIATQTLRFYRQSTKPTSADVSALLDSVTTLFRGRLANTEVEVVREYRTHEPLLCFEGELRQVFTNLVGNALDAMGAKPGRVVLRTSEHRNRGTDEKGILVTIADNGSGIAPATLARIFEPFYSTKGSRGTGLGLWVSKEIVDKHRATMHVRSRVGVGTVFSIFFPFRQASETQPQSDSAIA